MKKQTRPEDVLPKPVQKSDLKQPKGFTDKYLTREECEKLGIDYDTDYLHGLELWYTVRFGWCIPTLLISRAGRRAPAGTADRTYAIAIKDEQLCRIGFGPHVLKREYVRVHGGNAERLKPLLDLRRKGATAAHDARDAISTKRARGALRRRLW